MIEIAPKEYERRLNWNDGILYCSLLTIDDKNDWRLPTKEELNNIYKSNNDLELEYDYYWSSTDGNGHNSAWIQDMTNGIQYKFNQNDILYVRAVRSLNI